MVHLLTGNRWLPLWEHIPLSGDISENLGGRFTLLFFWHPLYSSLLCWGARVRRLHNDLLLLAMGESFRAPLVVLALMPVVAAAAEKGSIRLFTE